MENPLIPVINAWQGQIKVSPGGWTLKQFVVSKEEALYLLDQSEDWDRITAVIGLFNLFTLDITLHDFKKEKLDWLIKEYKMFAEHKRVQDSRATTQAINPVLTVNHSNVADDALEAVRAALADTRAVAIRK